LYIHHFFVSFGQVAVSNARHSSKSKINFTMKNKFQILLVAFCCALVGFAALSFKSDRNQTSKQVVAVAEDESGNLHAITDYAGIAQQKTYALDTLTTAGTYTTVLPFNMASAYQYQYFFKLRKIGVTPNIKVVLDEKNAATSSIWSAIDSFTMAGADSTKLNFRLRGAIAYGTRHRLRYVKTGNGAVARNVEIVIKPTAQ
jgi:hypothetical protein